MACLLGSLLRVHGVVALYLDGHFNAVPVLSKFY